MTVAREFRCLLVRGAQPIAMAERIRPIEQMLELSEEETMSPELLDSQVQKAQEQLVQLSGSRSRSKNKNASWKS